jgi:uncharacterized protein YciI
MNQYLITAYDFTDEQALERRLSARQQHLDGARALKKKGSFIKGGALINELGEMYGSVLILQFESDAELGTWKEQEPYLIQRVWETITIQAIRVADV